MHNNALVTHVNFDVHVCLYSRPSTGVNPTKRVGKKVAGGKYTDSAYAVRPEAVLKNDLAVAMGYRGEEDGTGKHVDGAQGVWSTKCTDIMERPENAKHLRNFDLFRDGALKVHGAPGYAVNPLKMMCSMKGCSQPYRISSALNSSRQMQDHLKKAHKNEPRAQVNRSSLYLVRLLAHTPKPHA